ncbi:MAG TPA: AraC family transcriptional regulator [Gemmatimonadaceae bacterium]
MGHRSVPITMGSQWFRSTSTATCRFTEARFGAGAALLPHTHDRPIISVMLEGSFDTAIAGKRFDCSAGWSWTEPCEERHANYIGTRGARALVMQPDPSAQPFESIGPLLDHIEHVQDPLVALDARRLLAEMDRSDGLSALAMDALMVGMLVRVSRGGRAERAPRQSPHWLSRIRELLSEGFRAPPSLVNLAAEAGVTPTHLCHAFRRHTGTTIGRYIRSARASWAAEQLRSSDRPLSAIAIAAGYADQSHFIRECRRLLGASPSEYRKRSRRAETDGTS